MTAALFVGLLTIAVLLVYLMIAVQTWSRVHGARVVVCPDTQHPAAVRVDAGHAIVTAVWENADIRLTSCSRWPERAGCDQRCVQQIEDAPSGTCPRTRATQFFSGRRCAICRQAIEPASRWTLQPGFMNPATQRVDTWDEVAPQDLPLAIAGWRPLCPNCTRAEQRVPDRVIDRPGQ